MSKHRRERRDARLGRNKSVSALTLPAAPSKFAPVFDGLKPVFGNKIEGYCLKNNEIAAVRNVVGYERV